MSDCGNVDALFAEAFALVDATAPRKSKMKLGSVARRKLILDELRGEENKLRDHLTKWRTSHRPGQETAIAERFKRQRVEREREALRSAVYAQTQFLRGLHGLVSGGLRVSLTLNLCYHLHNFTRLPRDPIVRRDEYAALRRDARIFAAVELLRRETESLPVDKSHIETEFVHAPGEPCAITTKRVFVLAGCDVATTLRAACVAMRDVVVRCRSYNCVGVDRKLVDADALRQSNVQYRVLSVRRASEEDPEAFSIEARALTVHQATDDHAVVLWDFVDEDELHPLEGTPDISRQSVGVCLIRPEMGTDGVVRTVYRELSTRRYQYRGTSAPSATVLRYLASKRLSLQAYEQLFRDIMLEHIADEKSKSELL